MYIGIASHSTFSLLQPIPIFCISVLLKQVSQPVNVKKYPSIYGRIRTIDILLYRQTKSYKTSNLILPSVLLKTITEVVKIADVVQTTK